MRVAVSSSGYADAAGALLDANQLGATWFGGLVDRLSVGGFAGDDSFAGAWAATYDESAASVLECFAELVGALGNLSLLTEVSGLNHRRADEASIIVRPGLYVGGSSSHALGDRSVTVAAPVLPSALGGDDGNAPWWWDKAFDAVEGLVWPDADCSRLRSVGEEWRVAAGRLEQLVSQVDVASHLLSEQRSPEIADALATLADVRVAVEQLVMSMRELGDGCCDHADEVEKHRDMIIEIGKDFLVEAGITQALTWGLTAFTLGGSQAVGQSAQAVRIAMYAAKIRKVLDSLKDATATVLTKVQHAVVLARSHSPGLRRIVSATAIHADAAFEAGLQAKKLGLKRIGDDLFESPAGVVYGPGPGGEHRLTHLLQHAYRDPLDDRHSVFAEGRDVLKLIDEAFVKERIPVPGDNAAFIVDMGDVIGSNGQERIRMVFYPGTNKIRTAYPVL